MKVDAKIRDTYAITKRQVLEVDFYHREEKAADNLRQAELVVQDLLAGAKESSENLVLMTIHRVKKSSTMTTEALRVYARGATDKCITRTAVVGAGRMARIAVGLILQFMQKQHKLKFFPEREAALHWLLKKE